MKTNGKGVVEVTAETFWNLSSELTEMVMDKDEVEHNVRIVQAPSYDMQYINDAEYFPKNPTLEAGKLKKPREIIVHFRQGWSASPTKGFRGCSVVSVQPLSNITLGKEIRVLY